ncbi:MAG: hypothetical protein GX418_09405 [Clostridiales bacterium]|nr:hypothetical protein [Clostridiales bacterium]
MEFIGLDAARQTVRTLRLLHMQWNRRYYEAGDFALQMRAADWDTAIAYVCAAGRPETGMVEKVETERTLKGDFVNVSGYFLEGMLNWKIVYPRYSGEGNVPQACRALVRALMGDTGVLAPEGEPLGQAALLDIEGDRLGDAAYAALRAQELGQRIRLIGDQFLYEVWQGTDRTQSQTANPYAVFSRGFGTVDSLTLTRDTSALRNCALAVYEGGQLTVDLRAGTEPQRMLYVETGLAQEEGQTEAAFLAAVEAQARAELAEYPAIVNIDATALQRNIRYGVDYDLGDRCDVRDDTLGLSFEARIIEANEVWKTNEHTVSLQFGDKLPTATQRGKA